MSVIDDVKLRLWVGDFACSNSAVILERFSCCRHCGVEDIESHNFSFDPTDPSRQVQLFNPPNSCPVCGTPEWELIEVTNFADVPDEWRWVCVDR